MRLATGEVALFGGEDPTTGTALDTAEMFDPATHTWSPVPGRMTLARGAGVQVFVTPGGFTAQGGEVVIAGGNAGRGAFMESWTPQGGFSRSGRRAGSRASSRRRSSGTRSSARATGRTGSRPPQPPLAQHRSVIAAANTQHAPIHVFGIGAYGPMEQLCREIVTDSGGRYVPVP